MNKSINLLLLVESIESQRAIEKLAELIVDDLTMQLKKVLKNKKIISQFFNYIVKNNALPDTWTNFVGETTLGKYASKVKFLHEFLKTFKDAPVVAKQRTGKILGEYWTYKTKIGKVIKRGIHVNIYPKEFVRIIEDIHQEGKLPLGRIGSFWFNHKSVIIHEITHAYDAFLAHDKFTQFQKKHMMARGGFSEETTAYLTAPHEVNARYSETVKKLENIKKVPTRQYRKKGGLKGAFENYLRHFKAEFVGWTALEIKQQQRLEQRLLKEYMTLSKDQEEELIAGSLAGIMWHFAYFNGKPDYNRANDYDERLKVKNSKLELKKILKKAISKPDFASILFITHEGVFNALESLFTDETRRIPFFQKEMGLNEQEINALKTNLQLDKK